MCYSEKTHEEAKNLRIIDDALFRLIAQRKEVCQEILRTLVDDNELEVITANPQERLISTEREIVVDVLCRLSTGTYCNIEMQKGSSEDDIKRTRFHASIITSTKTPKGTNFCDIPTVKILYITEYDALKNNQAVTHVSRCQNISGTYVPVDDGEDIIFANTAIKDNSEQAELLQLFLEKGSFYSAKYPELSEAIRHYKESQEGVNEVCKSIENYAMEIARERENFTKAQDLVKYVEGAMKTFNCTLEKACEAAQATVDDYNAALKLISSQVPA